MKSIKVYLEAGFVLLLLILCFAFGFRYHKRHFSCGLMQSDTVRIYDTIQHTIIDLLPYPYADTVIYHDSIYKDIDTAAILKDYFADHVYSRSWQDSLIKIMLIDTIQMNKPKGSTLKYNLLAPQTTIINQVDNSLHYQKYINVAIDQPLTTVNDIELSAAYISKRYLFGVGYQPFNKAFTIKAGYNIIRIK